jgi:hypothetical protein
MHGIAGIAFVEQDLTLREAPSPGEGEELAALRLGEGSENGPLHMPWSSPDHLPVDVLEFQGAAPRADHVAEHDLDRVALS